MFPGREAHKAFMIAADRPWQPLAPTTVCALKCIFKLFVSCRSNSKGYTRLLADSRADPNMLQAMRKLKMHVMPAGGDELKTVRGKTWEKRARVFRTMQRLLDVIMSTTVPKYFPVQDLHVLRLDASNEVGKYVRLILLRPNTAIPSTTPIIFHIHGGGMVMLDVTLLPVRNMLFRPTDAGFQVVTIRFTNGCDEPFPAGLNDCLFGLTHITSHFKSTFGGHGPVIVMGESGGGALTLATGLLAKQQGKLDLIDGLFAYDPAPMAGCYVPPPSGLDSILQQYASLLAP